MYMHYGRVVPSLHKESTDSCLFVVFFTFCFAFDCID